MWDIHVDHVADARIQVQAYAQLLECICAAEICFWNLSFNISDMFLFFNFVNMINIIKKYN